MSAQPKPREDEYQEVVVNGQTIRLKKLKLKEGWPGFVKFPQEAI